MVAEKLLMNEYETPRVQVRGVFLCDNLAVPVSVWMGTIDQDDWVGSPEETVGDGADTAGDIGIQF
jgi:hypothetical protein